MRLNKIFRNVQVLVLLVESVCIFTPNIYIFVSFGNVFVLNRDSPLVDDIKVHERSEMS
jgi:hypothetical protein